MAAPILYEHLARCHREGWNEGYLRGDDLRGRVWRRGGLTNMPATSPRWSTRLPESRCLKSRRGGTPPSASRGTTTALGEAYRRLLDEISARGLRPVGCSYKEGLWDEIAQRDPAQYRTKISVAVE